MLGGGQMCQILDGRESKHKKKKIWSTLLLISDFILSSCNHIWIKALNVDIPIFGTACFRETLGMIHWRVQT